MFSNGHGLMDDHRDTLYQGWHDGFCMGVPILSREETKPKRSRKMQLHGKLGPAETTRVDLYSVPRRKGHVELIS
jgi:hypothetical protein